jgi:hypothetical protein
MRTAAHNQFLPIFLNVELTTFDKRIIYLTSELISFHFSKSSSAPGYAKNSLFNKTFTFTFLYKGCIYCLHIANKFEKERVVKFLLE